VRLIPLLLSACAAPVERRLAGEVEQAITIASDVIRRGDPLNVRWIVINRSPEPVDATTVVPRAGAQPQLLARDRVEVRLDLVEVTQDVGPFGYAVCDWGGPPSQAISPGATEVFDLVVPRMRLIPGIYEVRACFFKKGRRIDGRSAPDQSTEPVRIRVAK
jgi:hypothetical protein